MKKVPGIDNSPGSAYLKITEGCNNRCSYCAIPLIRGNLRSRPAGELLAEARDLAGKGIKELVLIGQDTAVYGKDLSGTCDLGGLLQQLSKIEELPWIRLLYLHPAHIDQRIIDTVAGGDKVLPYLDIPIQHAADPMLKAMNRKHNAADLKNLFSRLRAQVDGLVLRTTVMLAFPERRKMILKSCMTFWEKRSLTGWARLPLHPRQEHLPPTWPGRFRRKSNKPDWPPL